MAAARLSFGQILYSALYAPIGEVFTPDPSDIHRHLVQLFARHPARIWTMNYDDLLEEAAVYSGWMNELLIPSVAWGGVAMDSDGRDRVARRAPGSVQIAGSEIRPIRGARGKTGDSASPERTGSFVPGGSYRLDKFPALKRLMHEWEARS